MTLAGEFPAGLKILIVDDDRTCLLVLERMLRKFSYQVTKCQQAREALALLRQDKNRFDIVLCDLHMPDINGIELLQIIEVEMDLPVVMMSSDDGKGVVMKGIVHGACDYLVKPVRMEAIGLIWQHVVRKKKKRFSGEINRLLPLQRNDNAVPAMDKRSLKYRKRTSEDEDVAEDGESSEGKKPRMVWTQELHDLFVAAVNELGRGSMYSTSIHPLKVFLPKCFVLTNVIADAVPKKILERMQAMNVTFLTRANIASHLQKYRMHLQKEGAVPSSDSRDVNAYIDHRNLQFQPSPTTPYQLPMQNLITERANENVLSIAPSHVDGGSNIFNSNVASDSSCSLPTQVTLYNLYRANLLYQNEFPPTSNGVAISNDNEFPPNDGVANSNDESLYCNIVDGTELSNPFPAVEELVHEPSFLVGQYDQQAFFRGPI
ncbi:hypothetical protein J1N35_020987 [Gossypium stocksii]|uniref:Response regulatory domain-containing protein n=1 Tax=Gossypium stocksii TaxID=47602 RepID=A0A9D3VEB7_9ROSI|nr:hypothetical protein J1N35_020987 [Gossypium stocksii]